MRTNTKAKAKAKEIRIWSKNPRYTDHLNINFEEIGKDDFEFDSNNKVKKDIYYDNLKNYLIMLINDHKKIGSMIDLLESLSEEGFDPNIDDIIVTPISFVLKNKIIYYSLEGNRRIFALNILLNTKNNLNNGENLEYRKIICEYVSRKYPDFLNKLENILENFDKSEVRLDEIEVKILDVKKNKPDYIWKILNSRHFGEKKGKLNWPRGLVLSTINSKVEEIRSGLKLKNGDAISNDDFNKLTKSLENFTGKKISKIDLEMSLWVSYCLDIYNSQKWISENEKIKYEKTKEDENEINDDIDNLNNKKTLIFSISSLELSIFTIKIISSQGIYETLSKIIGLDICVKRWIVTSKLAKNVLDNLIIYIINLIKNKKLNTRFFDRNYENEIKRIISLSDDDKKELDNLIKKDINKINPKYAPLSLLSEANYEEKLDFSEYTEEKKNDYLLKTKYIINKILPILDEINILVDKFRDEIKNLDNSCQYGLVNIWFIELYLMLENRRIIPISNFPLVVFSSALRSTSELLMQMAIIQKSNDNIFINKLKNSKFSKNFKEYKIKDWIDNFESDELKLPFIKKVYKYFFIDKESNSTHPIFNQKEILIEILKNIKIKLNQKEKDLESLNELSNKLNDFMNWSILDEKENGISNIFNALIHKPNLIKKIRHEQTSKFEEWSNEFNKNIDVIIDFIKFIFMANIKDEKNIKS